MSYNVATVRLSEKIGRDLTIKMAYRLGINAKLDNKPSLALGSSGVSLINMTAAYVAISNGGFPVEPYGISSIVTEKGELIYTRREQTATPIASSEGNRRHEPDVRRCYCQGNRQKSKYW